jgi:hypothetical protein
MASIKLRKGNSIVFQLLRSNLAGTDEQMRAWNEVKVVTLAVNPASIDYGYKTRSSVIQTSERNGYVDKFGEEFTKVSMEGTFGSKPRRVGLSLKDGYTRLVEFRDEIVRKSNRVNDELDRKENKVELADSPARYVYAVNYYDFINDEMFAIDISTFDIRLNTKDNPIIPSYRLSFTEIGDTIKAETTDGVLRALLFTSEVIDTIENTIDDALSYITDNEIFQTADVIVGGIDSLGTQLDNLSVLFTAYSAAVKGVATQASQLPATAKQKLSFTGIKG